MFIIPKNLVLRFLNFWLEFCYRKEMTYIWKGATIKGLNQNLSFVSPNIVTFCIIITSYFLGNEITASTVIKVSHCLCCLPSDCDSNSSSAKNNLWTYSSLSIEIAWRECYFIYLFVLNNMWSRRWVMDEITKFTHVY